MIIDEIRNIASERGRDYGHPFPNHLRASIDWTMKNNFKYTENPIGVAEKLGNGLKGVRVIETPKYDSYRDETGYVHVIDSMCKLYYEFSMNKIVDDGNFKDYSALTDESKTALIVEIKSLTVVEQLQLLIDIIEFLDTPVKRIILDDPLTENDIEQIKEMAKLYGFE